MSVGFFQLQALQAKKRAEERAERFAKAAQLPPLAAYEEKALEELEEKKAESSLSLAEIMDIIGHNCPFCDFRARSPGGLAAHVRARHSDGIKHPTHEE